MSNNNNLAPVCHEPRFFRRAFTAPFKVRLFSRNYQNVILYRQVQRSVLWHPWCRKRYSIMERRITHEQEGRCEIWGSQVESVTIQVVRDLTPCRYRSSSRRFEGSYCLQFLVKVDLDLLTLNIRAHLSLEKMETTHSPTQHYRARDSYVLQGRRR